LTLHFLQINGIDLVNKTHDEAVSIFRSQDQPINDLLVEIGAENRILNVSCFPFVYSFIHFSANVSLPIRMIRHEEDAESTASFAPSTHSYLDDVPRTPKRPMSYLDPRKQVYSSVSFVTIHVF
uniref:Ras-associating domain-containing protein n=1 Tax=Heligmosomoides polygyrus TaxID=6339 RepID=A0A183GCK2_HELPZ